MTSKQHAAPWPTQKPRTLARAQGLQGGLVAQAVLAGLHHQRQTAVDVLGSLLVLLQAKVTRRMFSTHPTPRILVKALQLSMNPKLE